MQTIILFPDKSTYMFRHVRSEKCEVYNVYKNTKPNIILKLFRKLSYFIGMGKFDLFYSDWTKHLQENVQFIVFDACKPYHRLEKKLRTAKIKPIVYFWNPINSKDKIKQLKKHFTVYSYSKADSQKYGIAYNPQFFVNISVSENGLYDYDGIFIGKNKSRLHLLERIYTLFDHPFFYVVKEGNENSEIIDLKDKQMPYDDYLQLVGRSRSVIEVLYADNADFSLRTMEALFYQKKLITNNKLILFADFYNEQNIFVLNENTTKEEIRDFLSRKFIPYRVEQINFYSFEKWLDRFYQ